MKVTALKLHDGFFPYDDAALATMGTWDYEDFLAAKRSDWGEKWISFDCLLADDKRDTIWCGIASFKSDICWAYDRRSGKFRSLDYAAVGDRFDAKFHRSLTFDPQGNIWAATARYHDADSEMEAPGGAIVKIDPNREHIEVIDRPIPHVYIQSILFDADRRWLYGQTYCPEYIFRYDTVGGECETLASLSGGISLAQAEQLAIDRNGTVWGTYGVGRAWANAPGPKPFRLLRYHPDDGKVTFLKTALPSLDGAGFARQDGMHTGSDGAVYMGTVEGLLCRIDPDTGAVSVIGKPAPGERLTAMANGHDGCLYGSCGRHGSANLFRFDPKSGQLDNLGPVFDEALHVQAWQLHDMAITADGTIYGGENDVPHRSSYLWQIEGACPSI